MNAKPVKLSPMQSEIIRDARDHTVTGRHTKRVIHVRGSKAQTWGRLWTLGLTTAPHEYADLTAEGLAAQALLQADPAAKVHPAADERKGGPAARLDTVPVERYTVRVTNESGRYPAPLPQGTTWAEALASYTEQLRSAAEGELVELLSDGEVARSRRKATVVPLPGVVARLGGARPAFADPGAASPAAASPAAAMLDRIRQQAVTAAWAAGTRVVGTDPHGQRRTGTTDGDVRYVTRSGHPNYGRAYVGVTWDALPSHPLRTSTGEQRQRPFVDELTRI